MLLGFLISAVTVRHSYEYDDIAFSLTGILFIQLAPESTTNLVKVVPIGTITL